MTALFIQHFSRTSPTFILFAHCVAWSSSSRASAFSLPFLLPQLHATFSTPAVGDCFKGSAARNMSSSQDQGIMDTLDRNPLEELNLPSPLLLGSGSYTRKLILKEMRVPFLLAVRPIDEKALGDRAGNPSDLVLTLAKAKGDFLVEGIMNGTVDVDIPSPISSSLSQVVKEPDSKGFIVLTADQVVTHSNEILEKPESIEEAKRFVDGYAKSPPSTVGAVVLTHVPSMLQVQGVDTAQINFKPSVAEENLIDQLLEDSAPVMDCAGGLMVEHPLVKEHILSIDGTEDSVMGLSKSLVLQLLREMKEKIK